MKSGPIDLSEVQDFSISKKSASNASALGLNFSSGKGKLDDMLTKLMKKNNYVSPQNSILIGCGINNSIFITIIYSHRQLKNYLCLVVKRNASVNSMKSFLVYRPRKNIKLSRIHSHLHHRKRLRYHHQYRLHRPVVHCHQTVNRLHHKNRLVLRLPVFQVRIRDHRKIHRTREALVCLHCKIWRCSVRGRDQVHVVAVAVQVIVLHNYQPKKCMLNRNNSSKNN